LNGILISFPQGAGSDLFLRANRQGREDRVLGIGAATDGDRALAGCYPMMWAIGTKRANSIDWPNVSN
jgi:hypothetical protein